MSNPNQLQLMIGRKTDDGKAYGIKHVLDYHTDVFDRWFEVKFKFRMKNNTQFETSDIHFSKDAYIMVKERWYHRVYSWIYRKLNPIKDEVAS